MLKPDRLITVLALGAGAALPRPARAQELADVCKAVPAATVGQWASSDATGTGSATSKLRLAVVGSERAGDSTLYWFEANFAGKDASHSGIVQVLTPSLSTGTAGAHAVIVRAGGYPAMRGSGQTAGMLADRVGDNKLAAEGAARCSMAPGGGWGSGTGPPRTVRALH